MLTFSSFSKSYAEINVLRIPDSTLPRGLVWLKGVNGAGKSTLLSCAAGTLPFTGDVSLLNGGWSLKKEAIPYRQRVGFSEADPVFPSFLRGIEIIHYFQHAKQGTSAQTQGLISYFQAEEFIHHPAATYSSGMNKKLSLILAFIGSPSLILLDEPLITLDQEAQHRLLDLMAEKCAAAVDILVSSHQELKLPSAQLVHEILVQNGSLHDPAVAL